MTLRTLALTLRTLALGALAGLVAALTAAAPASAQTTLAETGVPTVVSTYGGVTAYSVREDAGRYRLVLDTNSNGRAEVVGVPGRPVPFDVDLGPGPEGQVVAVYSRCAMPPRSLPSTGELPAPATGSGCDVYLYDPTTGNERRLEGASTTQASEFLPSVWRDEIAFARVYEQREGRRGRLPYVYVRSLDEEDAASRRLPGGARGESGLPGPTGLDLAGLRLGLAWSREVGDGGRTALRLVDTRGDGHRVIASTGFEDSIARFAGPQVSEGRLYAGFQRYLPSDGGADRSLASDLLRYDISTGALARAGAPAIMTSAGRDRASLVTVYATRVAVLRGEQRPDFTFQRYVARPRDASSCGDVGFEPQTDAGAFGIRAFGVSCDVARAVAAAAEGEQDLRYRARNFTCTGERRETELASVGWRCDGPGRDRITFRTS